MGEEDWRIGTRSQVNLAFPRPEISPEEERLHRASADSRINYRLAASTLQQKGVIPTAEYNRINVTASSQAEATSWLRTDASIQYSTDQNKQPFKGASGPLLPGIVSPVSPVSR